MTFTHSGSLSTSAPVAFLLCVVLLDRLPSGEESEKGPWFSKTCFVLQQKSPAGWKAPRGPCMLRSQSSWKTLLKRITKEVLKTKSFSNSRLMFGVLCEIERNEKPLCNSIPSYFMYKLSSDKKVDNSPLCRANKDCCNKNDVCFHRSYGHEPIKHCFPHRHYSWNLVRSNVAAVCGAGLSQVVFMDPGRLAFRDQNIMDCNSLSSPEEALHWPSGSRVRMEACVFQRTRLQMRQLCYEAVDKGL